jgi:glycosyltransferase involved in cell wall biosynthesis
MQQKKKFTLRGEQEVAALKKIRHVIGRTSWDKACAMEIRPDVTYHFCNETLRQPFYEGQWDYSRCKKHHIFAPSCVYPIKGFHYLLEAIAMVQREYPDVTVSVPGKSFLEVSPLRRSGYQKYLADLTAKYGLADRITFLGKCSAEEMKAAFLEANAFVLPSTIENSPNSLGEAMLLGVPCITADVGGVKDLLQHGEEGFIYQSTAPYMLAYHIRQVFAMEDAAEAMGRKAHAHAGQTHNPEKNLRDLLAIYGELK